MRSVAASLESKSGSLMGVASSGGSIQSLLAGGRCPVILRVKEEVLMQVRQRLVVRHDHGLKGAGDSR